jgi:hypothetical protein
MSVHPFNNFTTINFNQYKPLKYYAKINKPKGVGKYNEILSMV